MDEHFSSVVVHWLAAGDAGDLDAFDELLHPYAIVHAPAGLSTTSAHDEKMVWSEALCPTFAMTFRKCWWTAT